MKRILLINGPNLNMLGIRQPEIYGKMPLVEIEAMVIEAGRSRGIEVRPFQSNHEGAIIDFVQAEYEESNGVIINPGAFAHYSYALRDCLAGIDRPVIEVHLSNLQKREEWRKKSVIAEVCEGQISGMGAEGYLKALLYFE